jgi:hypothetical protein
MAQVAAEGQGMSTRTKRLCVRIALLLLLTLAAMELSLQAAGLLVRALSPRGSATAADGSVITILCVGDSHTYGLPLPEQDSYPAQLERALAERYPGREFRVVNLGIPGLNSGYTANRLERQVMQLRPDLVMVWVGINNYWNVIEASGPESRATWQVIRRALMPLKLFRLASIAWYTHSGYQYDPEQHGGWFEGELPPSGKRAAGLPKPAHPAPGLARDLGRMAETARAFDAAIVFVTYPMPHQRALSGPILSAGREFGVPVIDSHLDFVRALQEGNPARDLLDLNAGTHPSRLLYGYIVDSMLPVVAEQLGLQAVEASPQ